MVRVTNVVMMMAPFDFIICFAMCCGRSAAPTDPEESSQAGQSDRERERHGRRQPGDHCHGNHDRHDEEHDRRSGDHPDQAPEESHARRMVAARRVRNGTGVTHTSPAGPRRRGAVRWGCVGFVVLSPNRTDPNRRFRFARVAVRMLACRSSRPRGRSSPGPSGGPWWCPTSWAPSSWCWPCGS